MAVIVEDRIEQLYEFDLNTFYETSDLVQELDLREPPEQASSDPAIASVQAETSQAAAEQPPVTGEGVIENPAFIQPAAALLLLQLITLPVQLQLTLQLILRLILQLILQLSLQLILRLILQLIPQLTLRLILQLIPQLTLRLILRLILPKTAQLTPQLILRLTLPKTAQLTLQLILR
jgi:hypothetical protein